MLYKKILLIFFLLIRYPKSFTNHSINIEGNVELVNINENIVLNLTYNENTIYSFAYLRIYQDNELLYDLEIFVPDNKQSSYTLKSIPTYNTLSTIKLETNYYDNKDYPDSVATIKYYSPSNKTRMANFNVTYNSLNAINYKFKGSGNNVVITREFETFKLSGNKTLNAKGRYVDFSSYNYKLNPLFNIYNQNQGEVVLDININNLYVEDNKTILFLNTIKEDNIFYFNNTYEYYISKETGDISLYYDESYYDTLVPFFIPLSYGYDFYINGIITLNSVNKNQETFYAYFKVYVGKRIIDEKYIDRSLSKFEYVITNPLEGIDYES